MFVAIIGFYNFEGLFIIKDFKGNLTHENVYNMKFLCFTCKYAYLFKEKCTYEKLYWTLCSLLLHKFSDWEGIMD